MVDQQVQRRQPRTRDVDLEDFPGWASRVMTWLRFIAQLVAIHLLAVLGTLAGAVVAGFAPAITAASRLTTALCAGEASTALWHDFWGHWRGDLRRANLVAAPLWVLVLLLALDSWILESAEGTVRAALTVGLLLVGSYLVLVACYLPRVVARFDDPAPRTWRFLALAPELFPVTSAALLISLGSVAAVYWFVPQLLFLTALSVPTFVAGWIVDLQLDRLENRTAA